MPNCKIDRSVPAETPQSSTSASPKAAAVRDTEHPPPRLDRRRQQERFQSRQRQLPRSRNSSGSVTEDEKSPDKPVIGVNLHGSEVTDAGLEHLKGLPQLQTLNLWQTKVTDAGLVYLKGLTKLHLLDLQCSEVTDAGLEHLKGLTELQTLNLWRDQDNRCWTRSPQRTDHTPIAGDVRDQGDRRWAGTP